MRPQITPFLSHDFLPPFELKLVHKKQNLYEDLIQKKASMAVVGLGYVGLPLALHMASKYNVIGFDINESKVNNLKQKIDPCAEVTKEEFENKDIRFNYTPSALKKAKFYVVAVPTPIDQQHKPNLKPLKSATVTVAKNLKKGDCVVFESTVYPGCTEEVCVPILEEVSGLKFNEDFSVGYSPERINPGDKVHTFDKIKKIVSASNPEALEYTAAIYNEVVTAGIFKAANIKTAEAAKVVENTQRDVNIALMNELTYVFDKVGISIKDVLEAAGTKWNFLNFSPGLVGGHCIGVDPYYLIHKAKELKVETKVVSSSRNVNEKMANHIAMKIIQKISQSKGIHNKATVLVKGITFKENVKDVRNSKIIHLINALKGFDLNIIVEDPHADASEVKKHYGIDLTSKYDIKGTYDAVVMAVDHNEYHEQPIVNYLKDFNGFVFDIRGTHQRLKSICNYYTI